MISLLVKDKTISGKSTHEFDLKFEVSIITLKDLIESRVEWEVSEYNRKRKIPYNGLVTPVNYEHVLNEVTKTKNLSLVDSEKQIYVALNAFQKNKFFVIVDDKQVECLEDKISLRTVKEVSFIRLIPLVGG